MANFRKAVLIDGTGVPLTREAEHWIIYNHDGSLLKGMSDVWQAHSPDGTLFNISVTNDGTLDVSPAV